MKQIEKSCMRRIILVLATRQKQKFYHPNYSLLGTEPKDGSNARYLPACLPLPLRSRPVCASCI
jgi:hypothetical protein